MNQAKRQHNRVHSVVARQCAVLLATLLGALIALPGAAQQPVTLSDKQVSSLLGEARALVAQRQMQQAYELLNPHELALAGNADFDYLLGTAALDSGHPSLAIFALERVVEEKPAFAGARLELARAYFDVGNSENARYHFEFLLGQNPPPNVQQAITSYLRAIDRLASAYQPIHLPYFAGGFGWDSNANASTDVEQFLGFVLDGDNVGTDSSFYFATLGDYYSRPLSRELKLVLTGSLGQRNYPDASFVNATDVRANAGLEWNFGDTRVTPTAGVVLNWLDGSDNLARYLGDVAISHTLTDNWKLLGGVSAEARRFTRDLKIQDVDAYNVRLGFEHYLDPATGSVVSAMALLGTDSNIDSSSPFGNDRWALVVGGSRLIAPSLLLSLNAGAKNTDYEGNFFGSNREDDEWNAVLSLHLFDWPLQGWRVISRLSYTDVDSNIDLYTYDRTEVGITFHRSFE